MSKKPIWEAEKLSYRESLSCKERGRKGRGDLKGKVKSQKLKVKS
jgi:hypothetical protein